MWASLGQALRDTGGVRQQYRAATAATAATATVAVGDGSLPSSLPAALASARAPPQSPAIDQHAFEHSQAAYAGMARTDPDAVWVYQTWSVLRYESLLPYPPNHPPTHPPTRLPSYVIIQHRPPPHRLTASVPRTAPQPLLRARCLTPPPVCTPGLVHPARAVCLHTRRSWLGGSLGESYYRGWIAAPPAGKLILLDLMAEESPLWKAPFMNDAVKGMHTMTPLSVVQVLVVVV